MAVIRNVRDAAASRTRRRSRRWVGATGVTLAALTLAVAAAHLFGPGLTFDVEAASSTASTWLGGLHALLPLGFAFGAGMVSVVNPCGFAMLPAYLALYLDDAAREGTRAQRRRLLRAAHVSLSLTLGFVLLFGVAGVAIGLGARSLAAAFPWIGALTGIGLILAGAHLALGGSLPAPLAGRVTGGLAPAGARGTRHYLAFGLAYAAASLSCTLPVFLAVLGSTLTLTSLASVLASVALYALGMGAVVTAVTLALALFRTALTTRLRSAERWIGPLAAALLVVVGIYLVYYWLSAGGLLTGA